jgi:hypothetical protein
MSKIKYKMEVLESGSSRVRISTDVEMLVPGVYPGGESDWKSAKWNENSRSERLIHAIADAKKLGFVALFTTMNKFWQRRFNSGEEIEMVIIRIMGNGFTKKVNLFEVKVVLPSLFPVLMTTTTVCFGFTLEFNDSNAGEFSING